MIHKSLLQMDYGELYETIQEVERFGVNAVIPMYNDICTMLQFGSADTRPMLVANLWEQDVPKYTYGYNIGCPSMFILPNIIVLNLMNIYELAYQNSLRLRNADIERVFTAEVAHQILLGIARSSCNCYQYPELANAYNYLVEKKVWYELYPVIAAKLKQRYKIDFPTQVFDTIAGRVYSTKYTDMVGEISKLYYALATIIADDPSQVPYLVDDFNKATRFMLNLTTEGTSFPGLILVDNSQVNTMNVRKAIQLLNTYVMDGFEKGFRYNHYGNDNLDITLSVNLDKGKYHPFWTMHGEEPRV